MNKRDVINEVAKATCSKSEAEQSVKSLLKMIKKVLKKGDKIILTVSVVKRSARTGRNPQNSKPIKIKAKNFPKSTEVKELKDSMK